MTESTKHDKKAIAPDNTAVRTALWRALHVVADPAPHILEDIIGLKLAPPDEGWRQRQDMDLNFTRTFRASIVARARFIEDLLLEKLADVTQYVILGAGLDTFAQRRPDVGEKLKIFEVDAPGPQAWKERRLKEVGLSAPDWLHFVPVDFEASESWWDKLVANGFDARKPALISSTGVSMYLTRDAIKATLRQIALIAPGSTLAMTYILPLDLLQPDERRGLEMAMKGAAASGTPFVSLLTAREVIAMAREAGFKTAEQVTGDDLTRRYFSDRKDGLSPRGAEEILIATT